MDNNEKKAIDEEAVAEEEFVSDLEDTIENPLVYDGDKLTVQSKIEAEAEGENKEQLAGAIGSGELVVNIPFNNEEALRSENMNDGDNPFGSDSTTNNKYDGPDKAPLDNATETIVPSATASGEAPSTMGNASEASASVAEGGTASVNGASDSTVANSEAPVASNVPAAEGSVVSAPKKKKTGLIIGIVVVILLIGLAVGGAIFYMIHESKEQVVLDAVTNLIGAGTIKTDARQFDGTINMTDLKDADGVKSISFTFNSSAKASNFSGTGSLKISLDAGKDITIDVNAAYISNDGVYFKLDKLKEAIGDDVISGLMGGESSSTSLYDEYSQISQMISALASSAIEALDGNWFKINGDTFASNKDIKESYDCMTKAVDDLGTKESKEKIASIYGAHPFIENDDEKGTSDADGLKYYSVKTNDDKYKAFINEVKDLSAVKDLKTCMNSADSLFGKDDEDEKITAEIKLGITGWSHELKTIKGNIKSESANMDIDAKIGYEEKSVEAPTDSAKGLEDLVKDIMSSLAKTSYMKGLISDTAKSACASKIGTSTYNACIEQYTEYYTNMMMQNLMGSFIPSTAKTSIILK